MPVNACYPVVSFRKKMNLVKKKKKIDLKFHSEELMREFVKFEINFSCRQWLRIIYRCFTLKYPPLAMTKM